MSAILKKLEALEKQLPPRCKHSWPATVIADPEGRAQADSILRAIQDCPNCQGSGTKGFIVDISARHGAQDEGGEQAETRDFWKMEHSE